jgi:hypothetical protein
MRSPRGRGQQLDLLERDQRTELHREALDEVLVGIYCGPVRATVGIVGELPEMDELSLAIPRSVILPTWSV